MKSFDRGKVCVRNDLDRVKWMHLLPIEIFKTKTDHFYLRRGSYRQSA